MLTKAELDKKVAAEIGMRLKLVSNVTDAFIDELCNAVVDEGGFYLVGLGRLRARFEKGSANVHQDGAQDPMRITLYFSKSRLLKEQIERKFGIFKDPNMNNQDKNKQDDEGMTKYAVDEGVDPNVLEKAASKGCPICGAKCTIHGQVVECPTHGTEPFEK